MKKRKLIQINNQAILVAKIWNFEIRRVTLSACLFLMLFCQPHRMIDSVKLITSRNSWRITKKIY